MSFAKVIICKVSIAQSLGRSAARSLGRSIARSLDRSVARAIAPSIARSLELFRGFEFRIIDVLGNYLGARISNGWRADSS